MYDRLTESDIKKMQDEIEHRRLVVRKEALEAVKEARAQGDLSENFEYYAAKRDKNKNESRIRYLERMIKTATVVHDESGEDEIGLNNSVKVEFEDDGMEETYRIVTTLRGDSMRNMISIDSPIGQALMGHKVGDKVFVKVNDSISYYLIVREIIKTTDESGDEIKSF